MRCGAIGLSRRGNHGEGELGPGAEVAVAQGMLQEGEGAVRDSEKHQSEIVPHGSRGIDFQGMVVQGTAGGDLGGVEDGNCQGAGISGEEVDAPKRLPELEILEAHVTGERIGVGVFLRSELRQGQEGVDVSGIVRGKDKNPRCPHDPGLPDDFRVVGGSGEADGSPDFPGPRIARDPNGGR